MEDQHLSWAEIRATYPSQWVLVRRPNDQRRGLDPMGGFVLCHSASEDEVNRAMDQLPLDQDLASAHTDDENAPDIISTLEYITWRSSIEFEPFEPEPSASPPPPPRRWWRPWR